MSRATWKTCGLTTYRFMPHDGQFPWSSEGATTTDPEQALIWARLAKQSGCTWTGARPLAKILPNCSSPIRATW